MARINWRKIWESGIVFDTARDWSCQYDWLSALSNEIGLNVTEDAIVSAHRRWKHKLGLPELPNWNEITIVDYPKPKGPKYTWFDNMKRQADDEGKKILFIPDCHVKPGVRFDHVIWSAHYAVEKRPDIIVHAGDFADMPSLSSYDKGKAAVENKRYKTDIDAANKAAHAFMDIIWRAKDYHPRIIILIGNHENRITRAANDQAFLGGTLSIDDLDYDRLGWEVVPFLKVIEVEGILFSHFFPRSANGAIMQTKRGAPSAATQVKREMQSSIAGHKQGLDQAIYTTGSRICRGVIAGSFYLHDEEYLSPEGQNHWRGIIMLHQVRDGKFDLMEISLEYLWRQYGQ